MGLENFETKFPASVGQHTVKTPTKRAIKRNISKFGKKIYAALSSGKNILFVHLRETEKIFAWTAPKGPSTLANICLQTPPNIVFVVVCKQKFASVDQSANTRKHHQTVFGDVWTCSFLFTVFAGVWWCIKILTSQKLSYSTSSMDQGKKVWDFVNTELLVEEYEKYPCFYNTKIKECKDREKRKAALEPCNLLKKLIK